MTGHTGGFYKGQNRIIMEAWCKHYPSLMILANFIKRLQDDKKDLVVAVCGREGEGKSTLALILAFLIDNKFDLQKNVSYVPSENEIYERYNKELNDKSCYIIDEAIRSLYKLNFQSKEQQALAQIFATERYKCICTFLCIPRFRDLTENFRNWRCNLMIEIVDRGVAVVHQRDYSGLISDVWHIDESEKKRQSFLKNKQKRPNQLSIKERVEVEMKFTTYKFSLRFPALPIELEDLYEAFKRKSRTVDMVKPGSNRLNERLKIRIYELSKYAYLTHNVIGNVRMSRVLDINISKISSYMAVLNIGDKEKIDRRALVEGLRFIREHNSIKILNSPPQIILEMPHNVRDRTKQQ